MTLLQSLAGNAAVVQLLREEHPPLRGNDPRLRRAAADVVVARVKQPKGVKPPTPPMPMPKHRGNAASDLALAEAKLREFYSRLGTKGRQTLKGYGTLAIGVLRIDGAVVFAYTTASNKNVRGGEKVMNRIAKKMGLLRLTPDSGVPGRGGVGAPNDAEQLLILEAESQGYKIRAIAVSRRLCADCAVVVRNEKIPIRVVTDPVERPASKTSNRRRPKRPRPKGGRRPPVGGRKKGTAAGAAAKFRDQAPLSGGRHVVPIGGANKPMARRPGGHPTTSVSAQGPKPGYHEHVKTQAKVIGRASAKSVLSSLVALQFNALQAHELRRAEARLDALADEVEALRNRGLSVTLRLVLDAPATVDILKPIHPDIGQLIKFRSLDIISAVPARVDGAKPDPKAPAAYNPNYAPRSDDQRTMHDKAVRAGAGRKLVEHQWAVPGYHPKGAASGVAGEYRPVAFFKLQARDPAGAQRAAMNRQLLITDGMLQPKFLLFDVGAQVEFTTQPTARLDGRWPQSRTFVREAAGEGVSRYESTFVRDKSGLLIETTSAHDARAPSRSPSWSGKTVWAPLTTS